MPKRRVRRRQAPRPEKRELHIQALGRHGDGIADVDGRRVFVPFTLPGEHIRAETRGERGAMLEVLKSSSDRVAAPCPRFGTCGGCSVQHLATDVYRRWKRDLVVTALTQRRLDAPVAALVDGHGTGRRRMTVHARADNGRVAVGFMQARAHRISAVDDCPVLTPDLLPALAATHRIAARLAVDIDIQWTATDTGLDGDIRAAGQLDYDRQVALAAEAEAGDLARLTWQGDPVVERRVPKLKMGQADVVPAPGGFLQATTAGEEILSRLVVEHVGAAASVADLYCGVGPFALRLAEGAPVYAADGNRDAVAALDRAVRHTRHLKTVHAAVRDLAHDPLVAQELAPFEAVVFDPPRAGAQAQASVLAASDVPCVVAVSCDPATFARDAQLLVDGGYTLEQVTPVDQFQYTGHVEIVGLFRRDG